MRAKANRFEKRFEKYASSLYLRKGACLGPSAKVDVVLHLNIHTRQVYVNFTHKTIANPSRCAAGGVNHAFLPAGRSRTVRPCSDSASAFLPALRIPRRACRWFRLSISGTTRTRQSRAYRGRSEQEAGTNTPCVGESRLVTYIWRQILPGFCSSHVRSLTYEYVVGLCREGRTGRQTTHRRPRDHYRHLFLERISLKGVDRVLQIRLRKFVMFVL